MIEYIKSCRYLNDYPESDNEIVIVGRSNVGKSSFINSLYNRNIAYVGKTPGKTRLLNFFDIDGRYTMVDVPGYGYAKLSNQMIIDFGEMMDEYFEKREPLKLMVMIVDIRHKPSEDDLGMIEYARYFGINTLVIANKADKVSNNQRVRQVKMIEEELGVKKGDVIAFSSEKPFNIEEVKNKIESLIFR